MRRVRLDDARRRSERPTTVVPHVSGLTGATLEHAPSVCHGCVWWQSRGSRHVNKERWRERAEDEWGAWGALYRDDDGRLLGSVQYGRADLFPRGTGLADRFSDFVGRTSVQVGSGINFTHRFRIDKDDFTLRRNEVDAVVGSRDTYASVGYLRLNRDISAAIEDLNDREDVRVGGRVAFARYWSVFGSAVIDLTDRAEDPLSRASGFDPVRHRIGILYDDDCFEIGVTWRRDYETTGEVEKGDTFLIRVALRNLGR